LVYSSQFNEGKPVVIKKIMIMRRLGQARNKQEIRSREAMDTKQQGSEQGKKGGRVSSWEAGAVAARAKPIAGSLFR
jgi:hypothetical protein